jgi:S1-C subfamily serine protease
MSHIAASLHFPMGRASRVAARCVMGALFVVVCHWGSTEARGQDMDRATRTRVEEATVFIKIKIPGQGSGSGSGFVIESKGDTVLVMTNRHVAAHGEGELPPGVKAELTMVFRSGTQQQQELPGRLVTFDHRGVLDLALVEVKGVRQPPEPILLEQMVAEKDLFRQMRCFSLGFPRGSGLAVGPNANPEVTVNQMGISSFRRNDAYRLERIQFDGALIEGNSGGPIVNERGRLVGVVAERLRNESLGFAVPPNVITSFLAGDVDVLFGNVLSVAGNKAKIQVGGRMVDPLGKIRAMTLHYVRHSAVPTPPKADDKGRYPILENATVVPMRLVAASEVKNMPIADAAGVAEFDVPAATPDDHKLLLQVVVTDSFGRKFGGQPVPAIFPDKPGSIEGLKLVDPGKTTLAQWSCEANLVEGIKMNHAPGVTTISLPAGVALNHSPQNRLYNAPCALVRVVGDFDASVGVENTFDPGGEGTILPGGRKSLISFQSAGLLIWQDDKNFVRLERAKGSDGNIGMLHQVLIEIYRSGKEPIIALVPVSEQPLVLAAQRRGGSLKLLFAAPPKQMMVTQELAIDFDKEVFVGVAAANLSKRGFQAKLTNFNLKSPDGTDIVAKPYKMRWTVDTGVEKLEDGTWVLEGAKLATRPLDAPVVKQDMAQFKAGVWSDDRQLLWNIDKGKKALTLELQVEATGKYEIKAIFTKAPDYGIVKLDLGSDKPLYKGATLDLYSPEVKRSELMSLGTYTLSKGKARLNITNYNKNPKSSGFHLGIDEVRLVPVK